MAVHASADSCTSMQHTLMLSGLPFTSRGRAEVIERMRTTELVHHAFMMVKIQQPSTPSTLPPGVLFCLDYRTPPPCPCTSQGSRRRQTTRTRNVLFDCCRPLMSLHSGMRPSTLSADGAADQPGSKGRGPRVECNMCRARPQI